MLFKHTLRVITFKNPFIKASLHCTQAVHFDGNRGGEQSDWARQEDFSGAQNAELVSPPRFGPFARKFSGAKLAGRKINESEADQRFRCSFALGGALRRARRRGSQSQVPGSNESISRYRSEIIVFFRLD